MSNALITIFLGGGIGSVMRFGVQAVMNGRIPPLFFPWATLGVNVAGSFLIGLFYALSARFGFSDETRLFLTTGLCGGFTTFSTFSLESLTLLEKGKWLLGGSYMVLSVVLCLLGVALGERLSRI